MGRFVSIVKADQQKKGDLEIYLVFDLIGESVLPSQFQIIAVAVASIFVHGTTALHHSN